MKSGADYVMRNNAIEPRPKVVVDQRKLPRKRVLLGGVICDTSGENATDCTIRDMNVHGAQIESPRKLRLNDELYLVNTRNEVAHLARVAWINEDRAGLSFVRSYALEVTVPPQLEFLGRLLIDAKLRQVQTLIARGVPVEEATPIVGLTEDYLERFSQRGFSDEKIVLLLHQAKKLFSKS